MNTGPTIAPTDLRDFLKSQGWSLLEQALPDRLYVLSHRQFPQRQMVFPMDATAPDFGESVTSVIAKLSDLYGVPERTLRSRIESTRDDVLRLRVCFDGNDNALPLSFASTFVSSTEKLLKAGACTALRPRRHHPRLSLAEANQFVDKARFGQTEQGSFILQVACPVNAMEAQGSLSLEEERTPFVRQVTRTVQRALSQLTTAIEADRLDQLVDELKTADMPLVSSNLCEAVFSMHDDVVDNALDVEFTWSPLYRSANDVDAGRVRVQRDYFAHIEAVRRELRSVELDRSDVYIGTVERLEGEMGEDGQRSGVVVLSLLLPDEGESVRAITVLSAADYAKADRAHMTSGIYVRVTGCLRPGRQPRQLTQMTAFELLVDSSRST